MFSAAEDDRAHSPQPSWAVRATQSAAEGMRPFALTNGPLGGEAEAQVLSRVGTPGRSGN